VLKIHPHISSKANLPRTDGDCFKVGCMLLIGTVLILSLDTSKQGMQCKVNYYLNTSVKM
jgi:hypothetical protein